MFPEVIVKEETGFFLTGALYPILQSGCVDALAMFSQGTEAPFLPQIYLRESD